METDSYHRRRKLEIMIFRLFSLFVLWFLSGIRIIIRKWRHTEHVPGGRRHVDILVSTLSLLPDTKSKILRCQVIYGRYCHYFNLYVRNIHSFSLSWHSVSKYWFSLDIFRQGAAQVCCYTHSPFDFQFWTGRGKIQPIRTESENECMGTGVSHDLIESIMRYEWPERC